MLVTRQLTSKSVVNLSSKLCIIYTTYSVYYPGGDIVTLGIIELLFLFVEAVFVAPRSEEQGIAN